MDPDCIDSRPMARLMVGLLRDGLDLWEAGGQLVVNGPMAPRLKWQGTIQAYKPMLVAYLMLEEFTAR